MCYDTFIHWEESNGKEQWQENGTAQDQDRILRNVWWESDPSEAPQEWRCDRQLSGEYCRFMPEMSHENAHDDWGLGERKGNASYLCSLRGDVQAEAITTCKAVWKSRMRQGTWPKIGRVAVGVKNRVDRLKAIGNGQVPAVAKLAWEVLKSFP
jgi:hypothetical protein